jgi:hypothetical protein
MDMSRAEGEAQKMQKEAAFLRQKLQTSTARLGEVEGFATELHEDDEKVW